MPGDDALQSATRVLSATSLGVLLASANASTLDVALPVVARHFHAGASAASWALLSYLLIYASLLLVFGRLADLVGRRRLYLLGLATLTLASLASGAGRPGGAGVAPRASRRRALPPERCASSC